MNLYVPKQIKPYVETLYFDNIPKRCFIVNIPKNEHDLCVLASQKRWSNTKTGTYGSGLLNSKKDPYLVETIGLLGEMAFAKIYNLPVDLTYKKYGDKYDFIWQDKYKIDIKTSIRLNKYRKGFIYARNENGQEIPLKSDIYVFGYINYIDKDKCQHAVSQVVLVGYCMKDLVQRQPLKPSPYKNAKHFNKEIPYWKLTSFKPIS